MPTAGTIERQENYFFAMSSDFKQQTAVDVPMDDADLDMLLPLVEPSSPSLEQNADFLYDCDGVHIYGEYVNTELIRWTFSVQPSAKYYAGFMALARGAASAFAGTATDEVVTLTSTATGGTFTISMTFEGRTGTTGPLAFDASAADVQTALEQMDRPIEPGDVTVAGTLAAGMTFTFGGRLANTNLPAFTLDESALTGGTITQTETTAGVPRFSTITRAALADLPLISFAEGVRGDTSTYFKRYNIAVNSVTLEITRLQVSRITVELIGSTQKVANPTFTVPVCINPDPLRGKDTRLEVDGQFISKNVRTVTRVFNNNMIVDEDAYAFDSSKMSVFQRGQRHTETISMAVDGSSGDDIYIWANNRVTKPVNIYFGSPSNRAKDIFPSVRLALTGGGITFSPNGNSIVNIEGQPYKDATLGTYSKIEYYEDSSTPFLGT